MGSKKATPQPFQDGLLLPEYKELGKVRLCVARKDTVKLRMQRKKKNATLLQVALHFSVPALKCIRLRVQCQRKHPSIWMGVFFGYGSTACSYYHGYETDERRSLGLNGLALTAADTARLFSVQRSVCNAAHQGQGAHRAPQTGLQNQCAKISRSDSLQILPPQLPLSTDLDSTLYILFVFA